MRAGDPVLVDPGVAGHHRPVGKPHDQGRVVPAAVRIDEQAREPGEDRRGAEPAGEGPRHRGRADVVGDVALELGFRHAEIAEIRRHRVGGMVAQEQHAGFRLPSRISTGRGSTAGSGDARTAEWAGSGQRKRGLIRRD